MPIFRMPSPNAARTAVLGMSAAGTLALGLLIEPWETRALVPYWDKYGQIWTYCSGLTSSTKPGKLRFTEQECVSLEIGKVRQFEAGLDMCMTRQPPLEVKAAYISFAWNVGVRAACKSTLMRLSNAGDFAGACNQLSRWTFAGGQQLRGLVNRRVNGDATRISERTLCLSGLDPAYKPPILERVYVQFKDWRSKMADMTMEGV